MLSDWEEQEQGLDDIEGVHRGAAGGSRGLYSEGLQNDLFSVALLEGEAAQGHGTVTACAAGDNCVVVGTDHAWVIRYDFNAGTMEKYELSKSTSASVQRLFVDPTGSHVIAAVRAGSSFEAHYVHAAWKKARPVKKAVSMAITSVGWNRQQCSEASTREVVLGTGAGTLHEMWVDERDKREKHVRLLYDLSKEDREPVTGVQMEAVTDGRARGDAGWAGGSVGGGGGGGQEGPGTRFFVVAATPSRYYVFSGGGSLEATFAQYARRQPTCVAVPTSHPQGALAFYAKAPVKRTAERLVWMSGEGVYHALLNLGALHMDSHECVASPALIPYRGGQLPLAMAVTEYQFLLLYPTGRLVAVNAVSESVVSDVSLAAVAPGAAAWRGLATDAASGSIYLWGDEAVYEVVVRDEGRDMWRIHLSRGEYAQALEHCRTQEQRDEVLAVQAEEAFARGDFVRSASLWAKTASASFEQTALKFVEAGDPEALRTFLLHRQDHIPKGRRAQLTLVATWLCELYLDAIHREEVRGEGGEGGEGYKRTVKQFKDFLADNRSHLDEATTINLLGSFGREAELVYYATLREDWETVVAHHIQKGDAAKALATLRRPSVRPELHYKSAPALMALDPEAAVAAWMAAAPPLDPRRLLPALLRYHGGGGGAEGCSKPGLSHAVRYLEYSVWQLGCEDVPLHNLLVSLYVQLDGEGPLLSYLSRAVRPGGEPMYDAPLALRLALGAGHLRSCVHVYSTMGMFEESVSLALQVDLELAKATADRVDDDEAARKQLWLRIARHVVEEEGAAGGAAGQRDSIRKAIVFLKETDGLIKIEDILPFFPDFALIDDFKDAICASLEEYGRQIDELKNEMDSATRGADVLRKDISALNQRYAVLERDESCAHCQAPLFAPGGAGAGGAGAGALRPFYLFPCGHAFLARCLLEEVRSKEGPTRRSQIDGLVYELADASSKATVAAKAVASTRRKGGGRSAAEAGGEDPVAAAAGAASSAEGDLERVRSKLDEVLGQECPYCGELMVRAISQPFILEEEEEEDAIEAEEWRIIPCSSSGGAAAALL